MEEVVTLPPGIRLNVAMAELTHRFGHRMILTQAVGNLNFAGVGLPSEDKAKIREAILHLHRAIELIGEVEAAQEDVG